MIANLPKRGRISNLLASRQVSLEIRKYLPAASHSSSKLIVKCGIYFAVLKMEVFSIKKARL